MPQCGQNLLEYPERMLQKCPMCGEDQPILVAGLVRNVETYSQICPVLDKGYSFCNCSNIFYTDWENIDQRVYDEAYRKRYQTKEVGHCIGAYSIYFPRLKQFNSSIKSFAEIGCANEALLDKAKEEGWETFGIDINKDAESDKHQIKVCDLELSPLSVKTDVVWASHIFEHFKYPLKVAENVYESLNDKGLLFVAMPDPWYIDWKHPHTWHHWVMREHHILWDMDSFIEKLGRIGFKCAFHKRSEDAVFVCTGDYHLIFQKGKA